MAKLNVEQQSSTLFRLSFGMMDALYDLMVQDVNSNIQQLRALGVSDEEIYVRLKGSIEGNLDMFQRFKGGIEREMDGLLGRTAQVASVEPLQDNEKLKWTLDPLAREHCDTCKERSLMSPKPFSAWVDLGLPGFGTTDCGDYCRCTLEKA